MTSVQHKNRFRLLLYQRLIGRQRLPSFLLGVIFLGLWYGVSTQSLDWPSPVIGDLLLPAGLLCLLFWLFTLIGARQAYAQAREDHLRLQTPIFRLKIRYGNILSTKPVKMGRIFPPTSLRASRRHFLSPFIGHTALAIELKEYPKFTFFLRLFFHPFTFSPENPGFIILVEDWIGLSRQLSVLLDAWRTAQSTHQRSASNASQIIEESRKEKVKWWKWF